MTKAEQAADGGEQRVPRAWDRTARLLGVEAMRKLAASHVAVFGLGGVGSYAVEGLARSGVGRLTLVDFDRVCVTNINRQIHAFPKTVGKSKAELMAEHVRAINPAIVVRAEQAFYEAETAGRLLDPAPDYVIDAIDNVTAKLHLIAACLDRGIRILTCLGAAAKVDPTGVRVATLGDTHMDRLARAIRHNLKKKYRFDEKRMDEVLAVFSNEDIVWPDSSYGGLVCGVNCVCPADSNSHYDRRPPRPCVAGEGDGKKTLAFPSHLPFLPHKAAGDGNDENRCPSGEHSKHSCRKRHIIHGSAVFVTSVFGMTAAGVVARELTGRFPVEKQGYVIRERRLKRMKAGGVGH